MSKNPWVLALISAVATSTLGYLINQLPELPHKTENSKWIILSVVVITVLVWILAMLQNQSSESSKNPRTVVQNNWLLGKRNKFKVSQSDVEVRNNSVVGVDQEFNVDTQANAPSQEDRRI